MDFTTERAPTTFHRFLSEPIFFRARIILAIAIIPLVISFWFPLWRISMEAPQYPKGLWMDIYTYTLKGGNDGQHLQEINTLNHYIGMHSIDRASLSDLDWLPFAFGALVLLGLRVAVVGNVRSLFDLAIVTAYISVFGMGRFAYKMYVYGHELDPRAPVRVEPFMPTLLGTKQIGNFTTHAWPQTGTFLVGIFATTVVGLLAWHLIAGRIAAKRLLAARGGNG